MRNTLKFNIRNQNISRVDNFLPVRNSRNYLYAEFNFMTCDWNNVQKTALFKSNTAGTIPVILGDTDTCLIPWEVLEDITFTVSVYGGDLITVDSAPVKLYESGYKSGDIAEPTPDVYEQIISILQSKADGMKYENNILSLLSGKNTIATVRITGGSGGGADAREIELQNDGTYIQWRYVGELSWTNLVALSDITGPSGKDGADGKPGQNGKSAYEYAQDGGYTGTEIEFSEKLTKEIPSKISDLKNDKNYITSPATAEVGQVIVVEDVDENGKPISWETVTLRDGVVVIEMNASDTVVTLEPSPNTYVFPEMTELSVSRTDGREKELYHFAFASGEIPTILLLEGVETSNDSNNVVANKVYEVDIYNSIAVVREMVDYTAEVTT